MVILDEISMSLIISRLFVMSYSCIKSCKIFRFENLRNLRIFENPLNAKWPVRQVPFDHVIEDMGSSEDKFQ